MNEEEAIDNFKFFNEGDYITREMAESKGVVLKLLETKQAEIETLKRDFEIVDKECSRLERKEAELDLEITALKMKHEHDVKMIDEVKGEAVKLYKEIEKKDKIIKSVYREANNVLYFDDNSDYCCALWEILRIINPELEEYPTLNYIDEEDK